MSIAAFFACHLVTGKINALKKPSALNASTLGTHNPTARGKKELNRVLNVSAPMWTNATSSLKAKIA